MGIGVSDWRLARAVSTLGQLGVVSGTGIDAVLVRRLQDGDLGGHMRRAMEAFPLPRAAEQVLSRYFKPGGREPGEPYRSLPMHQQFVSLAREQLTILASFVEVHLAKEGHRGKVGMNLLTKVALPNPATLYGAMLAGVDAVLMGAGIPRDIPALLDCLAGHSDARLRLEVAGEAAGSSSWFGISPRAHWTSTPPELKRPAFLPIISSHALATLFTRKCPGGAAGFVVEGSNAGGHNAPPRGGMTLDARGEPVYGPRDVPDLEEIRALGLPFWLAGGMDRPNALPEAQAQGAAGIQVGTLFAYCDESGLDAGLKRSVLESAARAAVEIYTDPVASPTGYPFKVVRWDGDTSQGVARERVCDLGYLRSAYATPNGGIGYRCASEPVAAFVAKGGEASETLGRRCLCNALFANIGMPQERGNGLVEAALLTSGDELANIGEFLAGRTSFSAAEVIAHLTEMPAAD